MKLLTTATLFFVFLVSQSGQISSSRLPSIHLTKPSLCGSVSDKIYLKKGERQKLIFWSDDSVSSTTSTVTENENPQKIDLFLEAVNGGSVPTSFIKISTTSKSPQYYPPATTNQMRVTEASTVTEPINPSLYVKTVTHLNSSLSETPKEYLTTKTESGDKSIATSLTITTIASTTDANSQEQSNPPKTTPPNLSTISQSPISIEAGEYHTSIPQDALSTTYIISAPTSITENSNVVTSTVLLNEYDTTKSFKKNIETFTQSDNNQETKTTDSPLANVQGNKNNFLIFKDKESISSDLTENRENEVVDFEKKPININTYNGNEGTNSLEEKNSESLTTISSEPHEEIELSTITTKTYQEYSTFIVKDIATEDSADENDKSETTTSNVLVYNDFPVEINKSTDEDDIVNLKESGVSSSPLNFQNYSTTTSYSENSSTMQPVSLKESHQIQTIVLTANSQNIVTTVRPSEPHTASQTTLLAVEDFTTTIPTLKENNSYIQKTTLSTNNYIAPEVSTSVFEEQKVTLSTLSAKPVNSPTEKSFSDHKGITSDSNKETYEETTTNSVEFSKTTSSISKEPYDYITNTPIPLTLDFLTSTSQKGHKVALSPNKDYNITVTKTDEFEENTHSSISTETTPLTENKQLSEILDDESEISNPSLNNVSEKNTELPAIYESTTHHSIVNFTTEKIQYSTVTGEVINTNEEEFNEGTTPLLTDTTAIPFKASPEAEFKLDEAKNSSFFEVIKNDYANERKPTEVPILNEIVSIIMPIQEEDAQVKLETSTSYLEEIQKTKKDKLSENPTSTYKTNEKIKSENNLGEQLFNDTNSSLQPTKNVENTIWKKIKNTTFTFRPSQHIELNLADNSHKEESIYHSANDTEENQEIKDFKEEFSTTFKSIIYEPIIADPGIEMIGTEFEDLHNFILSDDEDISSTSAILPNLALTVQPDNIIPAEISLSTLASDVTQVETTSFSPTDSKLISKQIEKRTDSSLLIQELLSTTTKTELNNDYSTSDLLNFYTKALNKEEVTTTKFVIDTPSTHTTTKLIQIKEKELETERPFFNNVSTPVIQDEALDNEATTIFFTSQNPHEKIPASELTNIKPSKNVSTDNILYLDSITTTASVTVKTESVKGRPIDEDEFVSIQQTSNVNGPLSFDNIQYYDDPESDEDYFSSTVSSFFEDLNNTDRNDSEISSSSPFPVGDLLNGIYQLVQSYITPKTTDLEALPLPTEIPLNVHNALRNDLTEEEKIAEMHIPLPKLTEKNQTNSKDIADSTLKKSEEAFLPGNFLRGHPERHPLQVKVQETLPLREGSREAVNIPLPDLINEKTTHMVSQIFLNEDHKTLNDMINRKKRSQEERSDPVEEEVNCSWNIKTEEDLYLLVTFHNLSAPFTVDCEGAYIEVERENNGFDARWCGNRVIQGGTSPHVIFAKSEVRITVFDDGDAGKNFPTGFSAEVEVIDLFDGEHQHVKSEAYSNVKKLVG